VKIVPGKPYQNKTCTIKVGPMYRKRGNRDNSLKKVGI